MSKSLQQAKLFIEACNKHNFTWTTTLTGVRIEKKFPAGSVDDYANAEYESSFILDLVPLRGGSIWGTDGGSVGGHIGLTKGHFYLTKSGRGSNFTKALMKMGAGNV